MQKDLQSRWCFCTEGRGREGSFPCARTLSLGSPWAEMLMDFIGKGLSEGRAKEKEEGFRAGLKEKEKER